MNDDSLKLTVYFGEHKRVGSRLLSDVLLELYERRGLRTAVLMRGIEGFGAKRTLHTARLLTLSEELPLVSVAVDERARIEELVPELSELVGHGLVTLEHARTLAATAGELRLPEELHAATKLTLYCGRTERIGGRPGYEAVVELLRTHGVAGATVFLGVDGMAHGVRERAAFFSRNAGVPVMIVAVGEGAAIARAVPKLGAMTERPLLTFERVRLCKRDGVRLAGPLPQREQHETDVWEKLAIYAGEQARHGKHPLYVELVRRLREAGAAGATVLQGIWGYSGAHAPHGDKLLSLRRRVPAVTIVIDRPDAMRAWWEIVDELTDEAGLVTSEIVPGLQAPGSPPGGGSLSLSRRRH